MYDKVDVIYALISLNDLVTASRFHMLTVLTVIFILKKNPDSAIWDSQNFRRKRRKFDFIS